jgi:hypothetical protein
MSNSLPLSSALGVHIKRQLSQRFLKQSYSKNGRLIRQLPILKLRVAKMVQVLGCKLEGFLLRAKEYYRLSIRQRAFGRRRTRLGT